MLSIRRHARGYLLTASMRLPRPVEQVFPFFADPRNLQALTPPSLHFRILTPLPLDMRAGAIIDYRLRVHGVPVRWRTEIRDWDPPRRFVDVQVRGPYRWWIHEHRFDPDGDGTIMHDRVEYGVPGGPLAHALVVKRDLRAIFAWRARTMAERFGG